MFCLVLPKFQSLPNAKIAKILRNCLDGSIELFRPNRSRTLIEAATQKNRIDFAIEAAAYKRHNTVYILAEPAGLAPHSNVYLSVPGGGCSFLTKLFFPLMGVDVVWSEQEKWGCLFFALLGVVGALGGSTIPGPWVVMRP